LVRLKAIAPALGLALSAAVGASQASSAEPVWTAAPTWADAAKAYPPRARAAHLGGGAMVTCTVGPSGALRTCGVLGESPAGYGFGNAARKLAEQMRASRGPDTPAGKELRLQLGFRPEMLDTGPYIAPDPVWLELPSAAEFQAAFPKTESGANRVRIVLLCDVAAGGALAGCAVESEEPAGQGYGAAALALTPKIRVGLLSAGGVPLVGAKIRVPVRYEITPVATAKP
jgi:TonB family protein